MGFADLHIHTKYSWDGVCSVASVLKYAKEVAHLQVVAITDHDHFEGALEAQTLAADYGMEVIPGMEVSSRDGHILAYFIEKSITKGMSAEATIEAVGEQGGLCVAAHPMARGDFSLSAQRVMQLLKDPDLARILVGIETINAGLVDSRSNKAAYALAQMLPVAHLGNSDAHLLWMIGGACTEFAGRTATELRQAMEEQATRAVLNRISPPLMIMSDWFSHFMLRRLSELRASI